LPPLYQIWLIFEHQLNLSNNCGQNQEKFKATKFVAFSNAIGYFYKMLIRRATTKLLV